MKMKPAVTIVLFLQVVSVFQKTLVTSFKDDEWDYKEKGPETDAWCQASYTCCNGTRQSPFVLGAVQEKKMYTEYQIDEFLLIDYDKEIELTALNNGKTVVLMKNKNSISPMIGGANMDKNYTFHSIQIHWGSKGIYGSEHAFNGPRNKGEMEVQLVHYKSKFPGYDEAVNSKEKDALSILSIVFSKMQMRGFFQIRTNNISTAMTSVVNALPNIMKPGQTTTVTLKLQDFYDVLEITNGEKHFGTVKSFLHYMGSLTAPPCSEIVRWYIFVVMTLLSDDQLNVFQKLEGKDSSELSNNFRPLNPKRNLTKLVKILTGANKGKWKKVN